MSKCSVHPMLPQPYRIDRRRHDIKDTFSLELLSVDGQALPFQAGQFCMLYVFGVGEVPISISGDPGQPQQLVHTIRAVGTVTRALQGLKRGATIGVRGPYGSAWPMAACEGRDVLLIAGGIGLAPLRPALYHLLAGRQRYGKIALLYGTRSPADILYARQLQQWRARFDMEVEVTVDQAPTSWHGNVGVVTRLIDNVNVDPLDCVAMICGPEVMMRFTLMELFKLGLPERHIYLSMERNMQCAVGFCGHCQFGPTFICKDGPVLRYDTIKAWFGKREI
jgi:NAD(P)H-flavin reductase